jgi:hypothetical protein
MDYSPMLSIATGVLEIGAAAWALRGPGRRYIIQPTAIILLFLAGYQIVEAVFCTGLLPMTGQLLPRLAFVIVAWLPPTGLLLVARLYPTTSKAFHRYAYAMYAFCALLVAAIALDKYFVSESVCMVVFARYTTPTTLNHFYGFFYQTGLMSMLLISAFGVTQCNDHHQRHLLGQVLLGCIGFIFPALVTVSVIPIAEDALPSILCHFALVLALFLIRLVNIERQYIVNTNATELLPSVPVSTGMA